MSEKKTCATCRHESIHRSLHPGSQAVCDHPNISAAWSRNAPWHREAHGCTRWERRREPVMVDEEHAQQLVDKVNVVLPHEYRNGAVRKAIMEGLWPEEGDDGRRNHELVSGPVPERPSRELGDCGGRR